VIIACSEYSEPGWLDHFWQQPEYCGAVHASYVYVRMRRPACAVKDSRHVCESLALLGHAPARDDTELSVLTKTTQALFKRLAQIGTFSILSVFLAGCGGGGGGEEKPPDKPPTQEMKWDTADWDEGNWA